MQRAWGNLAILAIPGGGEQCGSRKSKGNPSATGRAAQIDNGRAALLYFRRIMVKDSAPGGGELPC